MCEGKTADNLGTFIAAPLSRKSEIERWLLKVMCEYDGMGGVSLDLLVVYKTVPVFKLIPEPHACVRP